MKRYVDLSTETPYWSHPKVKAIGWLEGSTDFPTGEVSRSIQERLEELISLWPISLYELYLHTIRAGFRDCDQCFHRLRIISCGCFGIPSTHGLFLVSSMILHAIQAHGYLPPSTFLDSLEKSPMPCTPKYREAVAEYRKARKEKRIVDYQQWEKEHPGFLGAERSLRLLFSSDPRCGLSDYLSWQIHDHSHLCGQELIENFRTATASYERVVLLRLIAEACLPIAIPLLTEQLQSGEPRLQRWAMRGLQYLGTPEARKVLQELGHEPCISL